MHGRPRLAGRRAAALSPQPQWAHYCEAGLRAEPSTDITQAGTRAGRRACVLPAPLSPTSSVCWPSRRPPLSSSSRLRAGRCALAGLPYLEAGACFGRWRHSKGCRGGIPECVCLRLTWCQVARLPHRKGRMRAPCSSRCRSWPPVSTGGARCACTCTSSARTAWPRTACARAPVRHFT